MILPVTMAHAQSSPQSWSLTTSTDLRFFSWQTTRTVPTTGAVTRESGLQVFSPLGVQLTGTPSPDLKIDASVRTGFISSSITQSGIAQNYSGLTDTTVSGTVSYLGFAGLQPFFSLALNVPTGHSLIPNGSKSKGDTDLALVPTFGEGFNIGPTIGLVIPVSTTLTGSLSAGYTSRGAYDREGPFGGLPPSQSLKPGDVYTGTASFGYRGEQLSLKGSLAYSGELTTRIDGSDYYRSGDRIVAQLAAGYGFDPNWSAKALASFSHFQPNKVLNNGVPPLQTEAFNSNSDVFKLNSDITYTDGNWSLGPTAGYLIRDHNSYDPTTFSYVTAKQSWTAGATANYAPFRALRLATRIERLWAIESSGPDKVSGGVPIPGSAPARDVTLGWQMSLTGSYRF